MNLGASLWFPFEDEEWLAVRDATEAILQAVCDEDRLREAACREAASGLISRLEQKYGAHPILIETRADVMPLESLSDCQARIAKYEEARAMALRHELPIYTVQLSLANLALLLLDDPQRALAELDRGRHDLAFYGGRDDRALYAELTRDAYARLKQLDGEG